MKISFIFGSTSSFFKRQIKLHILGYIIKIKKCIANEKEIQTTVENNLHTIFELEFIATEFSVSNYRLDTLAYDKENNSFVIIEYKNTEA
jgi:hypothetical protein